MTGFHKDAAVALALALADVPAAQHPAFLAAVIDVATGGLMICTSRRSASEVLYQAADAIAVAGEPA